MTNTLRAIAYALLLTFSTLSVGTGRNAGQAFAQTQRVTIAILMNVAPGKKPEEAVAAMQRVVAFIRTKPGLISEQLLQSSFPNNKPSYIDLMQWRSLDDWLALSASPDFLELAKESSSFFTLRPAEVFTPVQ